MTCKEYPGFVYPENFRHTPMRKEIYNPAPSVYVFSGYGESNFSVVLGDSGYLLVDTGSNAEGAEEALKVITALTQLPLAAVFLTHCHPDHISGGEVFLRGNMGSVPVWARSNFGAEQAGLKGLEAIAVNRAAKQFGVHLPDEKYLFNSMTYRAPGGVKGAKTTPIAPTMFLEREKVRLRVAGIDVELHAAPGETPDHMAVWLPGGRVLFCGDSMYRSFPNIYPLRGSAYRDLATWAQTLRNLAECKPDVLAMGHNAPASGPECRVMLANYAEALQFVLDETIKGMNAGMTPDELAVSVRLPERLRNLPYLAEYYGSIPWAVRAVFCGLLGWFDGNPSNLVPLPPQEEAERMARMAGGVDKLLEQAESALREEDWRWAAQVSDYVLLLGDETAGSRAKKVKADALEALSDIVLPITGKNYLLTCAQELRQ